ncbi:hypothetical protein [Spirosoma montaniterrae]|uniref:Outer membrane protein beta-barrel domain-containing protein n=1 Tax=Spirosoma montaniterrae TaxID=1178516 RepID=A0A1P9WRE1_9BACT|nr:hypothetical protein [Spirosoma montaniterrae]AQG77937.1 hypothetical protein AWR27_00365 [Spirosoma montaniterrae]
MQRIYRYILTGFIGALLLGSDVRAQTNDENDDNFQTVTTFGISTNTNSGVIGGFAFRQSKRLDGTLFGRTQYRYLSVELVNVKHPKELSASIGSVGSRFITGKENFLFVIRPQYGREVKVFQRDTDEGISVSGILAGGPSLGIIKPYYLEVSFGNSSRQVPASQVNGFTTPTGEAVTGAGSLFRGFGESKFTVGLNLKAALSFELSAFRTNTTGVEIGFLTEIFPQRIVIVPNTEPGADRALGNRSFFTSGYLTLFFGTKK